jgi:rhamnose transport system permease protein
MLIPGTLSREMPAGLSVVVLALIMAVVQPIWFSGENLNDLLLGSLPVLIIALGMLLVILTGQIDISVGAQFAVCGIAAGVLAKSGIPVVTAALGACFMGGVLGAINGGLVAFVRIPSIVVTLASMVTIRDALRWATQGAWVDALPREFQWFGLSRTAWTPLVLVVVIVLIAAESWALRYLAVGRAIIATGSNAEAARLAGIHTTWLTFAVFCLTGALTGLAAVLNAARFNQIPTNAGLGLEMKVIAAVVVGGSSIRGGRGTVAGTVLGVILLSMIGPALTFLGVNAYWEKALQGAIILTAVVLDAIRGRAVAPGAGLAASRL